MRRFFHFSDYRKQSVFVAVLMRLHRPLWFDVSSDEVGIELSEYTDKELERLDTAYRLIDDGMLELTFKYDFKYDLPV